MSWSFLGGWVETCDGFVLEVLAVVGCYLCWLKQIYYSLVLQTYCILNVYFQSTVQPVLLLYSPAHHNSKRCLAVHQVFFGLPTRDISLFILSFHFLHPENAFLAIRDLFYKVMEFRYRISSVDCEQHNNDFSYSSWSMDLASTS